MCEIIYFSYRIFSLWVLLCYQFQTHETRLKQNDILFHSLLILKTPFSKENFKLNNKFFIVQKIWDGKISRIFFRESQLALKNNILSFARFPRLSFTSSFFDVMIWCALDNPRLRQSFKYLERYHIIRKKI